MTLLIGSDVILFHAGVVEQLAGRVDLLAHLDKGSSFKLMILFSLVAMGVGKDGNIVSI